MFRFLAGLLLVIPLGAFAQTPPPAQSDTIPTNLLEANFSVAPNEAGTQLTVEADLIVVGAANGMLTETALTQSADEIITFSDGTTTITYDPVNTATDVLPLSTAGGTYTFTFKRSNGETYTGSVAMPATAVFSSPTPNQVFQKTDAVTVAWSAVTAEATLAMIGDGCSNTNGDLTINDAFTAAVFPAGYASNCTGAVAESFAVINANGGTGFGSFTALSQNTVNFSWGASPSPLLRPSNHYLAQKVRAIRRAGLRHARYRVPSVLLR